MWSILSHDVIFYKKNLKGKKNALQAPKSQKSKKAVLKLDEHLLEKYPSNIVRQTMFIHSSLFCVIVNSET